MDLKLTPVTMPTTIRPGAGVRPAASASAEGVGGSFSGALKGALQSVSATQNESTRLQREVQMENPKVSLEETMVAIHKTHNPSHPHHFRLRQQPHPPLEHRNDHWGHW